MSDRGPRRFIPAHIPISAVYMALTAPRRFYQEQLIGLPQEAKNYGGGLELPHSDLTPTMVGDVGHEAVAAAVQEGLSKKALEHGGPRSAEVAEEAVRVAAPNIDAEVQTVLMRWMINQLFPQLAQTDIWSSLEEASTVKMEYQLETYITVDDVSVRLHGRTDILYKHTDGWKIADLKISPVATDDLLLKYIAQVSGYAYAYNNTHQTSIVGAQVVFIGDEPTTVSVDTEQRVPELVSALQKLAFRSDKKPFEPIYNHELPWSVDDFDDPL